MHEENRAELGGVVLALRRAELSEDVLIPCDDDDSDLSAHAPKDARKFLIYAKP